MPCLCAGILSTPGQRGPGEPHYEHVASRPRSVAAGLLLALLAALGTVGLLRFVRRPVGAAGPHDA